MNTDESGQVSVTFTELVLGFSSAALYYLGEGEVDGQFVEEVNFPLARHNIEVIQLLRDKSRGNLSSEEEQLLGDLLADLNAKYLSKKAQQ